VETERERGTTRLSVAGQQTPNAHGPDAHTHTMVVQAAVTPSRTRRLLLKLPVGTLRRNSEERVRREMILVCALNAGGSRLSRTVTCVLVCAAEEKIEMIRCLCLDIMDVHLLESFCNSL